MAHGLGEVRGAEFKSLEAPIRSSQSFFIMGAACKYKIWVSQKCG